MDLEWIIVLRLYIRNSFVSGEIEIIRLNLVRLPMDRRNCTGGKVTADMNGKPVLKAVQQGKGVPYVPKSE